MPYCESVEKLHGGGFAGTTIWEDSGGATWLLATVIL